MVYVLSDAFEAKRLLVAADSPVHALALARYQLGLRGKTGWPMEDTTVFITEEK